MLLICFRGWGGCVEGYYWSREQGGTRQGGGRTWQDSLVSYRQQKGGTAFHVREQPLYLRKRRNLEFVHLTRARGKKASASKRGRGHEEDWQGEEKTISHFLRGKIRLAKGGRCEKKLIGGGLPGNRGGEGDGSIAKSIRGGSMKEKGEGENPSATNMKRGASTSKVVARLTRKLIHAVERGIPTSAALKGSNKKGLP